MRPIVERDGGGKSESKSKERGGKEKGEEGVRGGRK